MARQKKNRIIRRMPHFSGFRPFGLVHSQIEKVTLNLEEYEAFKLCDYDMLNHAEAAEIMKISRPTFTRVYKSARKKIAWALTNGSEIIIAGGRFSFENFWNDCPDCGIAYSGQNLSRSECPVCNNMVYRVALAVTKNNFDSNICMHFGKAPWFYITDKNGLAEFFKNPFLSDSTHTGTEIAKALYQFNIDTVLAGRFGVKSGEQLSQMQIHLLTINNTITLKQILKQLKL